jgi:hypothetical protein
MQAKKINFQTGRMFKIAEIKWTTQEDLDTAKQPQKSEFETLQESQADLVMTLMMNGVI